MSFVDNQIAWQMGVGLTRLNWAVVEVIGEPRLSWLSTLSSQILVGLDRYYQGFNGWPLPSEAPAASFHSDSSPTGSRHSAPAQSESIPAGAGASARTMPTGSGVAFGAKPTVGPQFAALDPQSYLRPLLSAEEGVKEHDQFLVGVEGLFFDPQGHITFPYRAVDDGERTLLLVEREVAEQLVSHLLKMRFFTPVDIRLVSENWRVYGWRGIGPYTPAVARPDAVTKLLNLDFPVWIDPWPGVVLGGTAYSGTWPSPVPETFRKQSKVSSSPSAATLESQTGSRWDQAHSGADYGLCVMLLPAEHVETQVKILLQTWNEQVHWPLCDDDGYVCKAAAEVAETDWEALRIAALRPNAKDLDARTLPHELDWLRTAVHLHKGCYCGQETVARIVNLGRPPRQLCRVDLDGSTNQLPQAGDAIMVNGRVIGQILSAAQHYEQGPIALGLISRRLRTPVTQVQVQATLAETTLANEAPQNTSPEDTTLANARPKDVTPGNAALEDAVKTLIPALLTTIFNEDGKAWDSPSARPGLGLRKGR